MAPIDVHQHLRPEALLEAVARRRRPPRIRRRSDGWVLGIHGEGEWPVDLRDHDPNRRAALLDAHDVDRALVAPSSPLGIEALPADEAGPLLEAYHAGVGEL